jgi:hypothetical protein
MCLKNVESVHHLPCFDADGKNEGGLLNNFFTGPPLDNVLLF